MSRAFWRGLACSLLILAGTAAEAQLPVIYPRDAVERQEAAIREVARLSPLATKATTQSQLPIIDPSYPVRQREAAMDSINDNRIDPSRAERLTLVIAPTAGGRPYEAGFDGPVGFIDAVTPVSIRPSYP